MEALYQLFTLIVLTAGGIVGKHRGLTGQLGSLLGAVFGIGAAGIMWRETAIRIAEIYPQSAVEPPMTMYLPSALACALLFGAMYVLLLMIGPALRIITRPLGMGVLNMVAGAVWGVAKWVLLLSLFFNVLIGMDHGSPLMKASLQGDGNLASGILLVAPALTGAPDCDELAYRIQLMEARQFDRNHRCRPSVE